MKKRICPHIKKFLSGNVSSPTVVANNQTVVVGVREEYANAFRTESYIDFWTRVLALSHGDPATCIPVEYTTAARLPSYRLFAEHLLDPDQPAITRILALIRNRPTTHSLLTDYFFETANASLLCGLLLKDIENTRAKYRSLKTTLQSLKIAQFSYVNPFVSSALFFCRVRAIQASCSGLLKRLESSHDKARAKLRLINRLKHGSAISLVALTTSLTVIVASHALALLVATPGLIWASLELTSTKRLVKVSAQLDAAAKGTYILNRDLDTISRLVARLNDELEDMHTMIKFWLERGEDRLQASVEVARQLKKNESSFSQHLDELEEHLYLCFMTINRARNLVVKEILDPGQPTTWPQI